MERDSIGEPAAIYADLSDDCVLTFRCDNGHESFFALQQQKFEILFEMGAMALLDGYYREAVGSMAVSLERFFEFYVRVVCIGRQIEPVDLDAAWKAVSHRSEQQLGAFMFLHLLETGKAPRVESKMIEFRNKVVHQGFLPSRSEALAYGKWVFELIRDVGSTIRGKYADAANRVIALTVIERSMAHRKAGKSVGTQYHATFLGWPDGSWSSREFDTELKALTARRSFTWAAPVERTCDYA